MIVPVALIAAVGSNNVIGSGDRLPWRLPSDFVHFKRTTMGKPLIMGRRTFESIGKPLPGRTNIVVGTRADFRPEGVIVFDTLERALAHAQAVAVADSATEVMVGGGGEIYRQALPLADRLYITHVDATPDGDVTFPAIEAGEWTVVAETERVPDDRDTADYVIRVYARNPGKR